MENKTIRNNSQHLSKVESSLYLLSFNHSVFIVLPSACSLHRMKGSGSKWGGSKASNGRRGCGQAPCVSLWCFEFRTHRMREVGTAHPHPHQSLFTNGTVGLKNSEGKMGSMTSQLRTGWGASSWAERNEGRTHILTKQSERLRMWRELDPFYTTRVSSYLELCCYWLLFVQIMKQ